MSHPRILIAGAWQYEIYEEALSFGFMELGCEVERFSWFKTLYNPRDPGIRTGKVSSIIGRIENKFSFGPSLKKLNLELADIVLKCKPDILFVLNGQFVTKKTLCNIKASLPRIVLVSFNNDDPFSTRFSRLLWRHFLSAADGYDRVFVYRHKNIIDLEKIGVFKTRLLRSYYIKNRNFLIANRLPSEFDCDVIFIGHFENDGRDRLIKAILENGIKLKVYGTLWEKSTLHSYITGKVGEIRPLRTEYNQALNGSKIALAFFSKINNDTYTRRNFEIPAAGTFMLSEYSADLATLFKEGEEAEFFRNPTELMDKIRFYLKNDSLRIKIAKAGHERLCESGHEVTDRAREILTESLDIQKLISEEARSSLLLCGDSGPG